MALNLANSASQGRISQNLSSVQVPSQPNLPATDFIQVLNGASPFILMIVLIFAGERFFNSLSHLVEVIKKK